MVDVEPLVRRARPAAGRTSVLTLRVHPESLKAIDDLAVARGWTRADAVRSLLRAGMDAHRKGVR
jgi:hypothetical protein